MNHDFTFVLTGKYDLNHINCLNELKKYGRVILSTYKSFLGKIPINILDKYDEIILNNDSESFINQYGTNPFYMSMIFQSYLTYKGLSLVQTKYAYRLRCDMSISNVKYLIDKLKNGSDEKLYIGNYNFLVTKPYQMGDHIVGGKTDLLYKMYKESYETCLNKDFFYYGINRYHSNEILHYVSFLKIKNISIFDEKYPVQYYWHRKYPDYHYEFPMNNERYNQLLLENFDLIDYKCLEPFCVKSSMRPDYINTCIDNIKNESSPCYSNIENYKIEYLKI